MQTLRNTVAVVLGASSGIGRATALAFAARGADVVLAARRAEPLESAAEVCRAKGVRALAVPTDATDPAAVEALAAATLDRFGRIDVWVNNVGTGVFGAFQDAPLALHRGVIEANLLGAMHGTHAVLPTFLARGRGTLINMISMGGWIPIPFASAYAASKAGLRAFTASVRQELADRPGIHVCGVFPALVDTPGFVHGANVSGRALAPTGRFIAPETVAAAVVRLVRHPRDEVAVGFEGRVAQAAYALFPGPVEHLTGAVMRRSLRSLPRAPRTDGAILAPMREGTATDGGWRARQGRSRAMPAGLAVGAAALLLGGIALLRRG